MMGTWIIRSRRAAGAALLLAILTSAVGGAGTARADDAYFDATAAASGVDVTVTPGDQALGVTAETGALTAQAHLDALSASTAFASHPYPGQAVQGELGANDPFYVYSSYPDHPRGSQDLPVSTLSATSDATSSQAAASGTPTIPGLALGATSSTAKVTQAADGTIAAVSDAEVQGLTIAGVLSIADIHAHAEVKRDPGGKLTRSATFTFGSASVAGVPVAISSNGLVIAGTTVPLPIPTADVNKTLSTAGISLQEIAGQTTDSSAIAPALAIHYDHDVPEVGDLQASFLLGVARAEISGSPATVGSAPAPSGGPTAPVASSVHPSSRSAAPDPATAANPPPAGGQPPTGDTGTTTDTAATLAPLIAPAAPSGTGTSELVAQGHRLLRAPVSWISLYVIAIAACGLACGGGLLVRHLGVRAR